MAAQENVLTEEHKKRRKKQRRYFWVFIVWLLWILAGATFYSEVNGSGMAKGFYMAISVGYSIGWGFPIENSRGSIIFSLFYLSCGAIAVAVALGFFAESMISTQKNWFSEAILKAEMEKEVAEEQAAPEKMNIFKHYARKVNLFVNLHTNGIVIIGIWLLWVVVMLVVLEESPLNWGFAQSLYCTLSSLSTGGNWSIPPDSPPYLFFSVAAFAATGVPLMALAMSYIASTAIDFGDPEAAGKAINAKITDEELEMMCKFGLDDGDGTINRAEFILLCTVRLGALDPSLVHLINDRFTELDVDGSGDLTLCEIKETTSPDVDAKKNPHDAVDAVLEGIMTVTRWNKRPSSKSKRIAPGLENDDGRSRSKISEQVSRCRPSPGASTLRDKSHRKQGASGPGRCNDNMHKYEVTSDVVAFSPTHEQGSDGPDGTDGPDGLENGIGGGDSVRDKVRKIKAMMSANRLEASSQLPNPDPNSLAEVQHAQGGAHLQLSPPATLAYPTSPSVADGSLTSEEKI